MQTYVAQLYDYLQGLSWRELVVGCFGVEGCSVLRIKRLVLFDNIDVTTIRSYRVSLGYLLPGSIMPIDFCQRIKGGGSLVRIDAI